MHQKRWEKRAGEEGRRPRAEHRLEMVYQAALPHELHASFVIGPDRHNVEVVCHPRSPTLGRLQEARCFRSWIFDAWSPDICARNTGQEEEARTKRHTGIDLAESADKSARNPWPKKGPLNVEQCTDSERQVV